MKTWYRRSFFFFLFSASFVIISAQKNPFLVCLAFDSQPVNDGSSNGYFNPDEGIIIDDEVERIINGLQNR